MADEEVKDDALEQEGQDTPEEKDETEKDSIQFTKSWVGRVEAKRSEEMKQITTVLQNLSNAVAQLAETKNSGGSATRQIAPDIAALNEQWQTRILQGDVVGVLDEYTNLLTTAQQNISNAKEAEMEREIGKLSEQPVFAHVKDGVDKTARAMIAKGFTAKDAVEFAWEKNRANFMTGLVATISKENPSLDLLRGGKGKGADDNSPSGKGKLPPAYEVAIERDIKSGVVKDRKEWISLLSPQVKKTLGI